MYKKPPFSEVFNPFGRPRSPKGPWWDQSLLSGHRLIAFQNNGLHASIPLFESNKESNNINNLEVHVVHGGRQRSPSSQLSHPDLYVYRVTLVVEYLGWDDYHFGHSTVRLFLPGRGELPFMMSAKFSGFVAGNQNLTCVPFWCSVRTQLERQEYFIIHPLINSRLKGAGVGSYEDMRRVMRFKINATLP